jgi:hypothetical protein
MRPGEAEDVKASQTRRLIEESEDTLKVSFILTEEAG